MFVMALTMLITIAVSLCLVLSSWGKQVRAVVQNRVMAGAGRHQHREGRPLHFRLGCGIAGIAAQPSP